MPETITIRLSIACVAAIVTDDNYKQDKLYDELKNSPQLKTLLANSHGGGDFSFEIDQSSIDIDTHGTGAFSVDYIKHIHSGCRERDLDEEYDMLIQLSVNLTTAEALLTGEELPEREPYAY